MIPIDQKFCEKHKGAARKERWRKSANERGYGYKWQKLRDWFIGRHPLCEECLKHHRITQATDVDHIIPHKGNPKLFWDVNNLQALCHACHSRKTAAEDGGFGNSRRNGGGSSSPSD